MQRTLGAGALALALICWSGCAPAARNDARTAGDGGGRQASSGAAVHGWLAWRGPEQIGVSRETGLPDQWTPGGANHLWSYELSGRGAPVVAGNRVYAWGYQGQGPDLQEVLVCLDADSGAKLWEDRQGDFLSDIVYDRYSIGSPTVDAQTGRVYWMTSANLFSCYSAEGKLLWRRSLMEELGKLTFPNGRTGAPVVDGELVILHGVTANWGGDGPGRDRFYAFDKLTGDLVWAATPGLTPKDSSFSTPYLTWHGQRRVLIAGTGCGHLVCLDVRTGQPLWRYRMSGGGVNVSPVVHDGKVIALHEDENVDSADKGRMIALRIPAELPTALPLEVEPKAEAWRTNHLGLSSSPVLVGDTVYQTDKLGELLALDAGTGRLRWRMKLGGDQLHASPLYADGKLYLPLWHDGFYIIRPGATGGQVLSHVRFSEGEECLGAPVAWNGKVYLHTTKRLYCIGKKGDNPGLPRDPWPTLAPRAPGPAAALQLVPSEVILTPGATQRIGARAIDALGFPAALPAGAPMSWRKFIPPTARVVSEMDAQVTPDGLMRAAAGAKVSAGAWEATAGGLKGYLRGRVLPALPYREDFEAFEVATAHETDKDDAGAAVKFAYPPLPWTGARFKFEVRQVGGSKVLAKTLDNIFFQRATSFIGHPAWSNYTVQADVMVDGSRRNMADVGVINQRYLINLQGNWQQLQVVSNQDRLNVTVPLKIERQTWYRMKTRVDLAPDGSGVVRAKVWKRDEAEPAAWTIEAPHRHAHTQGAPGLYAFSPQAQFRAYLDNVAVTAN